MPGVKKNETRSQYVKRAIPELKKEGLTTEEAIGKAEGMYDKKWTPGKKK